MQLEEFRQELSAFRERVEREAQERKDPQRALDRLASLYAGFDEGERAIADQVIAEWALSDEEAIRFDAPALATKMGSDLAMRQRAVPLVTCATAPLRVNARTQRYRAGGACG